MNRRILKKRAKQFMDSFTREKIPAAFTSEEERRQYVSAFVRQYVGQAARFPEAVYESKKRMAAQLSGENPELYQREIRRIAKELRL